MILHCLGLTLLPFVASYQFYSSYNPYLQHYQSRNDFYNPDYGSRADYYDDFEGRQFEPGGRRTISCF